MIHEFANPVPCTTPLGDGYIWYMKPSGMLENDELAVILKKRGMIKHFTTGQVTIVPNGTYDIEKIAV